MDRGIQAAAPRQRSEDVSDWNPICSELKNLKGDLLNVEGGRLRIEAVVTNNDSGDVVRHLCVHALTPSHKDIVRYELDSRPPEQVASQLAGLVSDAQDSNTPAEKVINSIQSCLEKSGPYLFKALEPEKDPFRDTPMERKIPDFEGYVKNPLLMDSSFSVDRDLEGEHIRADATLYPELRYTHLAAYSFPHDGSPTPPPIHFKVRPPREFWKKPYSKEDLVAALHLATFEAMDVLVSKGTARASLLLQDPDIDARLKRGIVDPVMCSTIKKLAHGGRIMVEEGDTLACVRIESSPTELATACTWRIVSAEGPLLPNDPRLLDAHKAVLSLVGGKAHEQRAAIHRLNKLDSLAVEPIVPTRHQASLIADITTPELAKELSSLSRSKVRVVKPSTDVIILDLLQGFRSVALDFRDPGHSRMNPHDPDTIFFGFRGDGALKVFITSPLNNHLEALVPGRYFKEQASIEETVLRLAKLFNRQSKAGFRELRRQLDTIARLSEGEGRPSSMALRDSRMLFPPIDNQALNDAFETAAELALVYEADVPLSSLSEVKLFADDPLLCEMVVARNSANAPASMHLLVSEWGVHGIDLRSAAGGHYTFTLETPLALPEGREILTKLFRLLRILPPHKPVARWTTGDPIIFTPLFEYLRECERRFASSEPST